MAAVMHWIKGEREGVKVRKRRILQNWEPDSLLVQNIFNNNQKKGAFFFSRLIFYEPYHNKDK